MIHLAAPTKLHLALTRGARVTSLTTAATLLLGAGCAEQPQTAVASASPAGAAEAAHTAGAKPSGRALAPEPDDEEASAPDDKATGIPPPPRPLTAADIISDDDEDEGAEAAGAVAAEGKLMPGKDDLPIMQVTLVRHLVASKHLDDDDWVLDRVKATLSPTASVGEVNEALEDTGARVCELARPQIPFRVTLCVPLQEDREGVQRVADALKGHRAVVHAEPYRGVPANVRRGRVQ